MQLGLIVIFWYQQIAVHTEQRWLQKAPTLRVITDRPSTPITPESQVKCVTIF